MKTKGNWIIETSVGGYWCGPAHFDTQIRKAQIYHWKEAAEEQIDVIRRRKYISDETITLEVIPVVEPMELPEHEKLVVDTYNSGFRSGYAAAFTAGKQAAINQVFEKLSEDLRGYIGLNYLSELKERYEKEILNGEH